MKLNHFLMASLLSLAAAGSAHAGIKDWIKSKTQPQHATINATPFTTPSAAECDAFWQGVSKGIIQASAENQRKAEVCQSLMSPAAQQTGKAPTSATNEPKTLDTVQVQAQRQAAKPDMDKVMQAGGKGCGIGGMLGGLVGVDPRLTCAAGGLIGGAFSYNKQMNQARAVQAAAKDAGVAAVVETRQVADAKGRQHEELKTLTVPFDPVAVISDEPKTKKLMDKIADLSAKSDKPLTFRFEGPLPGCNAPRVVLNDRGVLAKHQVDDQCGKGTTYQMVITKPAS